MVMIDKMNADLAFLCFQRLDEVHYFRAAMGREFVQCEIAHFAARTQRIRQAVVGSGYQLPASADRVYGGFSRGRCRRLAGRFVPAR